MLTFIHTSDLHLDTPFQGLQQRLPKQLFEKVKESAFQSFSNIIDVAIQKKVDFLLICGDLYDGENRSLRAQIFLRSCFERLKQYDIQVYITHGNHDHLSGTWANIAWPDNVHYFPAHVAAIPYVKNGRVEAYIYGFSYPHAAVTENMAVSYKKVEKDVFHIGMLHGQADTVSDHAPYAPFTLDDLNRKEFHYWALGHVHKREILQQIPAVVYPGNIQGRHKKESGEKGCYVVELGYETCNLQFIKTAPILWETVHISIEALEDVDALLLHIDKIKENLREKETNMLIHFVFEGKGPLHNYLQQEEHCLEIIEIANGGEERESPFLWIASYKVQTSADWDRNALADEAGFVSDLLRQIDTFTDFEEVLQPLFSHRKAKKYAPHLTELEQRELLEEAETFMLMTLLSEQKER